MSDEVRETQAGGGDRESGEAAANSEQQLLTKIKKNRSRNQLQK